MRADRGGRRRTAAFGAAVAAAVACSAAGCRSVAETADYRAGVDDGYVLGSADAVKRLYWARQAAEAPGAGAAAGIAWEDPQEVSGQGAGPGRETAGAGSGGSGSGQSRGAEGRPP